MKSSLLLSASAFLLGCSALYATDQPLLAVEGKVIYQNKFDAEHGSRWKSAKGTWEIKDGALRGSEKPEDKHGAVTRLPEKLSDFVIEYEVKFVGAKGSSLSLNAAKGHLARIVLSPTVVSIQKDDMDHEGPDKAVVFARVNTKLEPGTWHKVRMEMVGDTLLGQVDGFVAWGAHELLKQERVAPGLTVAGQSAEFRNLKISEASLNPEWEKVKAGLPKPGEKIDPPAARAEAVK